MKKNIILICIMVCALFCPSAMMAQAPLTSTAENPIWYYIQVVGGSTVSDRVFTCEEDGTIHGREMFVTMDKSKVDTQLWRFEARSSANRRIYNKATGKMLHVVYDETKAKRFAVLADESSLSFSFPANGDYNNIRIAANEASIGGTSGTIYAWQSLPAANFDYAIEFRASTSMDNDNARFKFIRSGDYLPEISEGDNTYWYHITTARTGYEGKCITSVANSSNPHLKFELKDIETPLNDNQLWKVVMNTDASVKERVQLINKASGQAIGSDVEFYEYYYTQPSTDVNENSGWFIGVVQDNQSSLSTDNEDGSISYLNATVAGTNMENFSEKYNVNSGYAWIFALAREDVSIPQVNDNADFEPYVDNKRIYVNGADDYIVRNVYGVMIDKRSELKSGIYLVTVNDKTKKVLVR